MTASSTPSSVLRSWTSSAWRWKKKRRESLILPFSTPFARPTSAGVSAPAVRVAEAREMYERLLSLANDVGLLAEEYDPVAGRLVGNFPQGFSHVALVHTGLNLMKHEQEMAKATGQPPHNGHGSSAGPLNTGAEPTPVA